MNTHRRGFLRRSAGFAAALALSRRPAEATDDEAANFPIIDTHQHVWDLKKFKLPWLNGDALLDRDYTPDDYRAAAKGLNVVKAVYAEVAVVPEQRVAEADYVVELCRRPDLPTRAAVVGGSPGDDGFRPYLSRFQNERSIKGVRSGFRRSSRQNKQFIDDLRWLGERGLSFDLLVDPADLTEAAEVAAACPDTSFVLDHCGNAGPVLFRDSTLRKRRDEWLRGIEAFAACKNVACKISGVAENGGDPRVTADDLAPIVNHCLDRFGPDRVVFAGNWPVCLKAVTLGRWVELLRDITAGRGATFQRKLFHDNAVKVYRLDP